MEEMKDSFLPPITSIEVATSDADDEDSHSGDEDTYLYKRDEDFWSKRIPKYMNLNPNPNGNRTVANQSSLSDSFVLPTIPDPFHRGKGTTQLTKSLELLEGVLIISVKVPKGLTGSLSPKVVQLSPAVKDIIGGEQTQRMPATSFRRRWIQTGRQSLIISVVNYAKNLIILPLTGEGGPKRSPEERKRTIRKIIIRSTRANITTLQ
ncbi:hypothetical protein BSL78_03071 [Apostichopus japonicus]|uniref:Uncharacterized protein n=1 Tax=Stichopus japonicus TaxID=307972 RepID=A0A2G8LIE5_STIJA|nr:hypothetical protein BSL78_03071 [Apostichopus japonicus]